MNEVQIPNSSMTGQALLEYLSGLSSEDLQRIIYVETCCDYNLLVSTRLGGSDVIELLGTR